MQQSEEVGRQSGNRQLYLDLLRGVAILYIVGVRHLDDYASGIYQSALNDILTEVFLSTFVFISGYLLAVRYGEIRDCRDLKRFLTRRWVRIYPLYGLALTGFWALDLHTSYVERLSLRSFLEHLVFINMLTGRSVLTLWFVSMIGFFYLLYPVITYRFSVRNVALYYFVTTLIFVILRKYFALIDVDMLFYMPYFFIGVVVAKRDLIAWLTRNRSVLAGAVALFLVGSILHEMAPVHCDERFALTLAILGGVPISLSLAARFAGRFPRGFIETLAYSSYCMYLFHRIVYVSLAGLYRSPEPVGNALYLTLVGIPTVIAVAYGIQKFYDRAVFHLQRI